MNITELTPFQLESLDYTANDPLGIYLMVKPNPILDPPEQFDRWIQTNAETDQLVELGFLQDASKQFGKQLSDTAAATGRIFRVFRITDMGKAMFRAGYSTNTGN